MTTRASQGMVRSAGSESALPGQRPPLDDDLRQPRFIGGLGIGRQKDREDLIGRQPEARRGDADIGFMGAVGVAPGIDRLGPFQDVVARDERRHGAAMDDEFSATYHVTALPYEFQRRPLAGVTERSRPGELRQVAAWGEPRSNKTGGRRGRHAGNRHRAFAQELDREICLACRQRIDQDAPRALGEQNGRDASPRPSLAIAAPRRDSEKSALAPDSSSSITTSVWAGLVKRVVTRRKSARNSLAAIQPVVNNSGPRRSLAPRNRPSRRDTGMSTSRRKRLDRMPSGQPGDRSDRSAGPAHTAMRSVPGGSRARRSRRRSSGCCRRRRTW